ncbi:MAG: TolB family protein, partial [Acidimicrobiia bacterium]
MAVGAAAGATFMLMFLPDVGRHPRFEVRTGGGVAGPPAVPGSDVPATGVGPMVWSEAGDIWLYQSAGGERRPLTADGETRADSLPRFRGADRVTFVTDQPSARVLREADLSTGRTRDLATLRGASALDWSPDGVTLAVYASGDDRPGELRFITEQGQTVMRRFSDAWGRGGFVNSDELRVEWAADGRHLLVLDTGLDTSQEETLYVLKADGTDALPPRAGTWARWSADGRSVYCVCAVHPGDHEWQWQAIEVGTGLRTPLLVQRAMRPSVSPDGRYLAFDDGKDTPSVHVLDLVTPAGQPRRLTGAAMAPVWLDAGHLAVTDTRPCPEGEDECTAGGHGSMFQPAGTASVVDAATGERQAIVPGHT